MTKNTLYQRNIVSIKDLTLDDIELVLATAEKFKKKAPKHYLENKIVATCFFEPSTRTRLSFESATLRLGGRILGFSNDEDTSISKGETLQDTIRVVSNYADLITIRHPKEGAAALAAQVSSCPIINAGDGANQHPTQALLDFFTIYECQPQINGLSIALVGDLKYGRAIHSFTQLCALYDIRLYLVAPEALALPDSACDSLKKRGIRFSVHQTLEEVIPKVDILYLTRIQQERFSKAEYRFMKSKYILTANKLAKAKNNLRVLHPLPRINEIATDVDTTPHAYYFQQAENGVYVRQALLALILNEKLP